MCSDELYKFCDGTLLSVRRVFHDIAYSLEMDYLPKRRWSKLDKKRSRVMIKEIDQRLFKIRLMRNLEKFVGGREYKNDFRLLERTGFAAILTVLIIEASQSKQHEFIRAHQPVSLELVLIYDSLWIIVSNVWGHIGDVRPECLMHGDKLLLVAFDSQLKVFHPPKNDNTSEHQSDTKVFTMTMEILPEPISNKLYGSTVAKPCQGDSSEFYLITGSIYTDQQGTVVIATVFDEVTKPLSSIHVDYH
uniref:Uncharacterized protein n=1 Tax=Tanacetum cinerariifolium TaxID=118510 RepID=A0A6L2L729_TANCI|nr:hypothetical protein [Tanacetum cinerariifolium]